MLNLAYILFIQNFNNCSTGLFLFFLNGTKANHEKTFPLRRIIDFCILL